MSDAASRGFSRRNVLAGSVVLAGSQVATSAFGESISSQARQSELNVRLASLEVVIEQERQKLGVPGMALAIVRDNHIVFQKGFGVRDLAGREPITPATRFAIGSVTKTFTAFATVMSVDEGLLSLDENPKRLLPYFRLQDAKADARCTIRDLLAHTTGLMRSDLAWSSGVLTREQVIRVAGLAKPTAELRATFQYQNAMYAAVGEILAAAQGVSWERVIEQRLFAPLGMRASAPSLDALSTAPERAIGYDRIAGEWRTARVLNRHNIAPAGGIVSTAADMAQWVRFMLNRGAVRAGRLISDAGFVEMTKPVIPAGADTYALGLFVGKRGDRIVYHHGGGIDGFEAAMVLLPESRLGYILLTNGGPTALPAAVEAAVLEHLVGDAPRASAVAVAAKDVAAEAGRYVALGQGVTAQVALRDGQLAALFHKQPAYPLEPLGGRRYRFASPAPAGFFMTFRDDPATSRPEVLLEQPGASVVMTRLERSEPGLSAAEREIIGTYTHGGVNFEIEQQGDFAVLLAPDEAPVTLVQQAADLFQLAELPAGFSLGVVRDSARAVVAVAIRHPSRELQAQRVAGPLALDLSIDEIMAKALTAVGGEALVKRRSMTVRTESVMENVGLTSVTTMNAVFPQAKKTSAKLSALGREVGAIEVTCDGAEREMSASFSFGIGRGTCMSDVDYVSLINWKSYWPTVTAERRAPPGGAIHYVVRKQSDDLIEIDHYASDSFRLIRRDTEAKIDGAFQPVSTETFGDYRTFEGIEVPTRVESQSALFGRVVGRVTEVKIKFV